jgi:hypothetical protein
MANLKIVEEYNLPPWVDLGEEYLKKEYTYSVTVAFTGSENGKSSKPTAVGLNPFDEIFAFSVGGFEIAYGELYTSRHYGSDSGVRNYDYTNIYSEGDNIVFDVEQEDGVGGHNPDKVIIRQLTEQEKTYVDKVLEQNLNFMEDRRDELK